MEREFRKDVIIVEFTNGPVRTFQKREEDGAYDLFAALDETQSIIIPAFTSQLIPLGIKTAFSSDYVALFRERGSTGTRNLKVNAGVIDSGYRGEWFVSIYNANPFDYMISNEPEWRQMEYAKDGHVIYPADKAIVQVVFTKTHHFNHVYVGTVDQIPSERGAGKLGSTDEKENT